MRAMTLGILALALAGAMATTPSAAEEGNYHLLKKVILGGEGFWDYLNCDSEARRV